MAGLLTNNPLVNWLGVIRRETYQAASEDSRWGNELVSDLWPDIDPDSDSKTIMSQVMKEAKTRITVQ